MGDWGDDAVAGPAGPRPVALVDRRTRFLRGGRAAPRRSADVAGAEVESPRARPALAITPDRGRELASHGWVSRWPGGAPLYLCAPRHPWQRGTSESANGLIGELYPRGTDFSRVPEEDGQRAFSMIDDRPGKVLGFRTAREAYLEEVLHSA